MQARTYPHRTENGNKIQVIPGEARRTSAWKTITEILHRAYRVTACLLRDTKAVSYHVLIYVSESICLELSRKTIPPLIREIYNIMV